MRPVLRTLSALCTAGLVAATLSACTDNAPDPRPAAQALADALGSGDFAPVPLAGQQPADVARIVADAYERMGGIEHTHSVGGVQTHQESGQPPTADAVIRTVWDVDETDNDLAYDTTARFEYDEDAKAWQLAFAPGILAPGMAAGEYLSAGHSPAQRGRILGADGQVLVTARPVVRVGLDKSHIEPGQWPDSARALAELVQIDADAYVKRVAAAGEKAWVQAIVLRDDEDREASDAEINRIPGAGVQPDELPLAPTREFARALLGTVGPATAELIEKSGGTLRAGEQAGLSGLQAAYNQQLSGTPGTSITRHGADGQQQAELFSSEPVAGTDLALTLDRPLQQLADKLVADAGSPAAIVVIRPSDGAVLAAASGPESSGYNTALLGRYAPGSAFKVVSALAMLRAGGTPGGTVSCPPTTTVDGKSFKNYDGYPKDALGEITLQRALAESCNTAFVEAGTEIGAPGLAQAAAALGLTGQDTTGAGAFMGSVPADSSGTELGANMIGQGVVQASPLGMATVAASVAAGKTVSPTLVLDEPASGAGAGGGTTTGDDAGGPTPDASSAPGTAAGSNGGSPTDSTAPEDPTAPSGTAASGNLTQAEARDLAGMMAEVVRSGTLEQLRDVPGGRVIGKSGTAEYDAERNAHAWAIAAQGDLAIAAFVEDGRGGSQTAGPLVSDFLSRMPR